MKHYTPYADGTRYFTFKKVNATDAPEGFTAVEKPPCKNGDKIMNACSVCDARQLCIKNENNWCRENRCMSDGRKDGISVVFKLKPSI